MKRPARLTPPEVPGEPIEVAAPPKQQQHQPAAASAGIFLMPMMAGASALTMVFTAKDRPLIAVIGVLFFIGIIGFAVVMVLGQRGSARRQMREARERYLDYIEELRRRLRRTIGLQKASGAWRHPAPERLLDLARLHARRWERRAGDPDFLVVRIGVGDQPTATRLVTTADEGPLNEFDPVCLEASRQLRARYAVLREQPVCLELARIGVLSVVGDRTTGRQLARALVAQLVALHSPEDVRLGLVRAEQHARAWEWLKWLPHAQHPAAMDGEVPARLVATGVPALAELLRTEIDARLDGWQRRRGKPATGQRHLVVLVDGEQLSSVLGLDSQPGQPGLAELGIHVVMLLGNRREEPERVDQRVRVTPDGQAQLDVPVRGGRPGQVAPPVEGGTVARVDDVPDGLLPALARELAPLRLLAEESDDRLTATIGLAEVLGVADPGRIDPLATWRPKPFRDFLRTPIGVGADGRPVILDLKESAHAGMGPHGLIVGATGSGKSEMLRTLVCSLVVNQSPERLALMLVDFKGGATFAGLADLPHVAGMITNLADDLDLVDRMRDALFGEMQRRQEILKQAGNLPNVIAYEELRESGQPLEPLPHLLVIVDEFSELLTAKPDFADLFVAIGRIGRSIGVHLLLATQRLETGKIRGLESHLSYRIGLRTFSAAESQEAIGVSDAYHLPPEPGSGYLKVDTTVFERFKAALVSSPYRPADDVPTTAVPAVPYVSLNGLGSWLAANRDGGAGPRPAPPGERTVLDVMVERMAHAPVEKVRRVWLEPLPPVLPLDRAQDPQVRGQGGSVSAVLGLVDEPAKQRVFPLEWDFTGGGGNLMVVGAPQSGKSTLLRTLVTSLALRYPPGEVAFYCVDYGGGSLAPLERLPHVAGVAPRVDGERVSRVVSEVLSLLDSREQLFREYGLDSVAALRQARLAGRVPAEIPGDVFFVVDGWGSFREDFETLEFTLGDAATRASNYGVHFVVTVTQTMQIRMRMQAAFGGRIELRLNDPYDSAFDRREMQRISKETPGRGLVEPGLHFQAAVPRIDGGDSLDDLSAAQRSLLRAIGERWPKGAVREVQILPTRHPASELPPVDPSGTGVPVGISERDLAPVGVDLEGPEPHLLVYGDGESGKTNLLQLLLDGYVKLRTPDRLGIVLVDYRRTLLDVVRKEYLLAYCTGPQQTAAVATEIAGSLKQRIPGPDVTSEQLRDRSWWTGLDVLFVVDDYDLVATQTGNPLLGLLPYLPQARDLGLHLVLSRRTGGMARALVDPVIQTLNDLSTPGFMFSGDRTEGRLVNGVASQRLPVGRALYASRGGAQLVQVAVRDAPGAAV